MRLGVASPGFAEAARRAGVDQRTGEGGWHGPKGGERLVDLLRVQDTNPGLSTITLHSSSIGTAQKTMAQVPLTKDLASMCSSARAW